MKHLLTLLAGLLFCIAPLAARAQQTAKVVASCGVATYTAGGVNYITVDTTGNQCGGGSVTQSGTWTVQPGNTPNTVPWLFTPVPGSAASAAIVPVVSTVAESGHVLKASAGNLYHVAVSTGGTAGFLLVVNATSAPSNGAVAPLLCRAVAANSSLEVDHAIIPDRYGTGITALFSTTGCFTLTLSATATFEGAVQ